SPGCFGLANGCSSRPRRRTGSPPPASAAGRSRLEIRHRSRCGAAMRCGSSSCAHAVVNRAPTSGWTCCSCAIRGPWTRRCPPASAVRKASRAARSRSGGSRLRWRTWRSTSLASIRIASGCWAKSSRTAAASRWCLHDTTIVSSAARPVRWQSPSDPCTRATAARSTCRWPERVVDRGIIECCSRHPARSATTCRRSCSSASAWRSFWRRSTPASKRPLWADAHCRRTTSAGAAVVLALLLARVIIGARVAFFAPFLARGIDTAVGMWVAIAIVVVGLLSWPAWVPPLLTGARAISNGQISLRRLVIGLVRFPVVAARGASSPRVRATTLFTVLALGFLGLARPGAVAGGVGAGIVVLLAWISLAWVAAFASPYFETFERGAWSVVEQLAPSDRLASTASAGERKGWTGRLENWCTRIPELPIIAACLAAEVALLPGLAGPSLVGAIALLAAAVIVARRRRSSGLVSALPDYWGALAGAMVFVVVIASMRLRSENGSMAAFVLIVLVALVSVRIGRGVGARIDAATRRGNGSRGDWSEVTLSSALLAGPLLLLAPLMAIDMGLFLVVVLPVGFATLLAAGRQVAGRRLAAPLAAFVLLFVLLTPRVLFPSVRAIRDADSHASRAAAFDDMTRLLGVRLPLVSKSMDRVAARSVATADQPLAE